MLNKETYASTEPELLDLFNYNTPVVPGFDWQIISVTSFGVNFQGEELSIDNKVTISKNHLIIIAKALNRTLQPKPVKSNSSNKNSTTPSILFKSRRVELECLDILKNAEPPILNINGEFTIIFAPVKSKCKE